MSERLTVHDVHYSFGLVTALNGLTFSAKEGEVIGLLGPNGAGKTTAIRLMNGIYTPEPGRIAVNGLDPATQGASIRRVSGVLTETPALYERLTALANLEFFGRMSDVAPDVLKSRSLGLLEMFGLQDRASEPVRNFSKGMKQRLALARTLIADPLVLFLDEPTSGLDPESSQQVHELLQGMRTGSHRTVVLCTHNLYEAERLCDRLVILNRGKTLAFGTLEELRQAWIKDVSVQIGLAQPMEPTQWPDFDGLLGVETRDAANFVLQLRTLEQVPDILAWLIRQGARVQSCVPHEAGLEEIYFSLQQHDKDGVR